jgi:hypothetical protein
VIDMPRERNRNRPARVTVTLPEGANKILNDFSDQGLLGASKSEVVRQLLLGAIRQQRAKKTDPAESEIISNSDHIRIISPSDRSSRKPKSKGRIAVRSKELVVSYSKLIIFVLEEALQYDPAKQYNHSPPELWIDDAEYLQEIRKLVEELRRLNTLLEAATAKSRETKRVAINIRQHTNNFLDKFSGALGKSTGYGAGFLLTGLLASILSQLGLPLESVVQLLGRAHMPK